MPTVPVYNRQIRTAALPDAKVIDSAPREAFGAGIDTEKVDRALKGAATAVAEVYLNEQQRADEVLVTEAKKKLTSLELDLQFNPEYGYLNKKGKGAGEAIKDVEDRWLKGSSEIMGELSSDRQKAVFDREVGSRWESLGRHINQHAYSEFQKYDAEETQSFVENERNAAIANYQNPERVLSAIESQKQTIFEFGKRNGKSDEEIRASLDSESSKTHAMVVEQYLNADQDLAAKAYFDEFGGQIVGADLIRVKQNIEASSLRGDSQRGADEIFSKGLSQQAAVAEANKIQDPKRRDETVRRVKDLYETQRHIKQQMGEDLYGSLHLKIEKGETTYDKIPTPQLSLLSPAQREALNKRSRGEDVKTDRVLYNDLYRMATNEKTRAKFADEDLTQYGNRLGFAEHKELLRLQAGARKGDRAELDDLNYNRKQLDNALAQYGIISNRKSKGDMEEYNRAVLAAEEDLKFLQQSNGRKRLTTDEVHGVVDRMMKQEMPGTETTILGLSFGRKKVFELEPGDEVQVPDDEKQKITEALGRAGTPATEQAVLGAYLKKLRKIRVKGE